MKPPSSFLQAMEEYVKDAPQGPIVRKDQVWMNIEELCFFVMVISVVLFHTHVVDSEGTN